MNIAHIEERSFIYGPGCRYVIWTQGCSIRCKGCWNSSMWDFSASLEINVQQLFYQINTAKKDIEGITLLGGEPLDQYNETISLLRLCKEADISTMVFTGYEAEELENKKMTEILELSDILITGRYVEQKRTIHHQWIGSTNQKIHYLGEKYKNYQIIDANYTELTILEDGSLYILGFPSNCINSLLIPNGISIEEY